MNMLSERPVTRAVPEIVRIVLCEIARRRNTGELSPELSERQINRLCKEELQPRGLVLVERHLANGCTRFLVKEAHGGTVREMVDCLPS